MRNRFFVLIFSIFTFCAHSQDAYHLGLIESFKNNFSLNAPGYIFNNTEEANAANMYVYGAATMISSSVVDFDFTKKLTYNVSSVGSNVWDSGTGTSNKASINKNDILVFTFWAKRKSPATEVNFFVEDSETYNKEFYEIISFSGDWSQYFIATKAVKNYGVGKLSVGFHLASLIQSFELAGLTAFNFGQIDINDVPSSFGTGAYIGSEADAPWRSQAAARIENIRKADLNVVVKGTNGLSIDDAEVKIEMLEHEFGFGSAFVICRFPGNDCYNSTYVEKVKNLDGAGHGFNVGVIENALKWNGWEEEWIGSPNETVSAVQYLSDHKIKIRGHTLIWPGFSNMPADISMNINDLNYVRNRISVRIDEMINHPVLSQLIDEWDVLNEITQNRDLENAFMKDPNFVTGREIYLEIFQQVINEDPALKKYINDYVVLSGGGSGSAVVNRYKTYLDEIHNSDVPFDGIGFQGHIGSTPTSILKIEQTFDEFYERYGKRMKVTEYDINSLVPPEIQGKYMEDFLTMTFSHPGLDAFIMWGFWDGNHWNQNAPMFDLNWNLKPGGKAFIDKVFKEWWTNETIRTAADGLAEFRPFKGKHKVTVSKGGAYYEMEIQLSEDTEIEVILDNATSINDLKSEQIEIVPNIISNKQLMVKTNELVKNIDLEIVNLSGIRLIKFENIRSNEAISLDLPQGIYFARILMNKEIVSKRFVVL